jgi:CRP/FNR family cyclic AMP-dependent transcriptional regulator
MSAEQKPWASQHTNDLSEPAAAEAIRRAWPMASRQTVEDLARSALVVRALPSQLIAEGEWPARVALVLKGNVAATWDAPDGRTELVGLWGPGQFLGIATLAGGPMTVGIDALTPVTLLSWDSRQFRSIAAADLAMIDDLLDRAVFAVHLLTHLGKVRAFTTARSRLAGLLIKYEALCFSNTSPVIPRTQLGALTGVSPRMVNKILRTWEVAGTIERVGASGLVLLDRDALIAEAAPFADFPAPNPTEPGFRSEPTA